MFASFTDRVAGTLLTGLDAAVEFATLGEIRLVEPLDPADAHNSDNLDAAPLVRRPARSARVLDPALLPSPSTALARSVVPLPEPPAPKPTRPDRHGGRTRAALPAGHATRPAGTTRTAPAKRAPSRLRAGSVKAPLQLCLLSD